MNRNIRFNVFGELIARVDVVYVKPATEEFATGLIKQIDTVHDEVELGDNAFLLEIGSEIMDVIERECGLSAALSVPNDPFANTSFYLAFDCFRCKYLRVPHDVFFVTMFGLHVCECKAKQESETLP